MIYLTHWGIVMFSVSLFMDMMLVLWSYMSPDKQLPSYLVYISWALSTTTYCTAGFITVMYWSLLWDWGDGFPSYSNVFVHFLQVTDF